MNKEEKEFLKYLKERKTLNYNGKQIYIDIIGNGATALEAMYNNKEDKCYDYYSDISINLPPYSVMNEKDEIYVDEFCKNSGFEKALIDNKIIKKRLGEVRYNYGKYDLVQLNLKELYKYDPKGFKEYLSEYLKLIDLKKEDIKNEDKTNITKNKNKKGRER